MRLINKLKKGDKVAYIADYNLLTAQACPNYQNKSDITYPLLAIKKVRGVDLVDLAFLVPHRQLVWPSWPLPSHGP